MPDTFGVNAPIQAPTPEAIREYLTETEADIVNRRAELAAALDRMPETIEDEETAQRATDFSKQIAAARKDAESRRVGAKAPWDHAAAATHAFYKKETDGLDAIKRSVDTRIQGFLQAKAEKARREAAERERAAREEEDRNRREAEAAEAARRKAEREAVKAKDDEAAAEARERAAKAAAVADRARAEEEQANALRQAAITDMAATSTERSRTRGDFGSVASLRKSYDFEIEDLDSVPRQFLTINEKAIRDHIRDRPANQPPAPVAGLKFVEKTSVAVR